MGEFSAHSQGTILEAPEATKRTMHLAHLTSSKCAAKNLHMRTRMHAVVVRSTFRSQNV